MLLVMPYGILRGHLVEAYFHWPSFHLYVASYSDADWAHDLIDCQLISGYCKFMGGNLVTWCSKNRRWLLALVLRLSIGLWLTQHVG